ncbi:MAG: M23 family metallopeptidase [Spirochaetaceae bacterium]|jgi:murein DD-endopeptidase MepM/ murein hydrolase activator NlpD|nr:M23 family metallopeptidase [Spirochaetaceae bacterium]
MYNKNNLMVTMYTLLMVFSLYSQTIVHNVKRGDTLFSISQKYDVSVDQIMEINGISSPEQLKIGINLKISNNDLDFNENSWYIERSEYFVKKGDTLYSISRRNGISVSELLEMNNLSEGHVLHVGDKLFINSVTQNRNTDLTVKTVSTDGGIDVNSLNWPIDGIRFKMNGKLEGVRINADAYSYVRSIAAGKVVLAEPYRGFGNVILIDVNGYIYLYGGNEDVFVNVGEEVTAGTRIGRLGMSDLSDGKRDMFFSVFKDGKPIDTNTAPRG